MEFSLVQWAILNFTAFMYGFNKTGIVGSAIICTPLMLLYFTPGQTLGIILPLLVVADIITIILLRQSARWNHIIKAMPWAITGIVVGWLIARYTVGMEGGGDIALRKIIAATLVFLVLFGYFLRFKPNLVRSPENVAGGGTAKTWFACAMGTFGGITTMLANNGGPAWVVYLMSLGLSMKEFLGTAAWLFFIQNVTKVPFGINLGFITLESLSTNLYLLPALIVGVAVGGEAIKHISKSFFDNITQLLALAGALYLLFV
ncbi:MAG: sulfite exporter TauE/SafE family protein [Planctomycetaceae bacterium]|nr:sulfite exporter TauE/SafE family protein [Planctomycetaceae bacterium]